MEHFILHIECREEQFRIANIINGHINKTGIMVNTVLYVLDNSLKAQNAVNN